MYTSFFCSLLLLSGFPFRNFFWLMFKRLSSPPPVSYAAKSYYLSHIFGWHSMYGNVFLVYQILEWMEWNKPPIVVSDVPSKWRNDPFHWFLFDSFKWKMTLALAVVTLAISIKEHFKQKKIKLEMQAFIWYLSWYLVDGKMVLNGYSQRQIKIGWQIDG